VDADADGRPPLAQVVQVVLVSGTWWLSVRRYRYAGDVDVTSQCHIVELQPEPGEEDFVPVSAVRAETVMIHACQGYAPRAAIADVGGDAVMCHWRGGRAAAAGDGRHREIEHRGPQRYFQNVLLR